MEGAASGSSPSAKAALQSESNIRRAIVRLISFFMTVTSFRAFILRILYETISQEKRKCQRKREKILAFSEKSCLRAALTFGWRNDTMKPRAQIL
jgi:DNA-directed RNA polymerase specialized sigma24 family protein